MSYDFTDISFDIICKIENETFLSNTVKILITFVKGLIDAVMRFSMDAVRTNSRVLVRFQ